MFTFCNMGDFTELTDILQTSSYLYLLVILEKKTSKAVHAPPAAPSPSGFDRFGLREPCALASSEWKAEQGEAGEDPEKQVHEWGSSQGTSHGQGDPKIPG